jgi:hypothetical protein
MDLGTAEKNKTVFKGNAGGHRSEDFLKGWSRRGRSPNLS